MSCSSAGSSRSSSASPIAVAGSGRRQALRIQMYIVYVVAATVGLLLFLIDVRELLRAVVFE